MTNPKNNLFSIKMRASCSGKHISGAENIIPQSYVTTYSSALLDRAFNHANGQPDFVNIKAERLSAETILHFPALRVTTVSVSTPEDGCNAMVRILHSIGISRGEEIVQILNSVCNMRGAVLLHADTLERLEPDSQRGIRATLMDSSRSAFQTPNSQKNHFAEALVLATKVVHAPGVVAELCISDDPNYVTGYVASEQTGYVRLTQVKRLNSPHGGRIFLYRGAKEDVDKTIAYLETQPVLVDGAPTSPAEDSVTFSARSRLDWIDSQLQELKDRNLYRTCTEFSSAPDASIQLQGRDTLMFASNNYLNLANDPRVKSAAIEAIAQFGVGSGGSRLTTGCYTVHNKLERALAQFKGTRAALLFNTGFAANSGVIPAICGEGDAIFSDELNHASIIDGCRASKAKTIVYRHNDMADLECKIQNAVFRKGLVVSDAVFSMDGDLLNLPEFLSIAQKYDLFSMVDEAHSTGVIGDKGIGVCEYFGCKRLPDILVGTLSKALGAEGGFVCGENRIVDYLRNKARSFIFSTAMPMSIAAAALKALEILQSEPERVVTLRRNVRYFLNRLKENGVTAQTESAIIPVLVGDEEKAMRLASNLLNDGIYVSAIRYPTVKRGSARLRLTIASAHSYECLDYAAQCIARRILER